MSRLNLVMNSLSGASLWVVEAIAAFVLSPILVRYLGINGYGIWELMVAIVGYMGLLDLGFGPAILRYVAHATGANDPAQLRRFFSSGLWILTLSGVVGFVVVAVLGQFGNSVLNINPGEVYRIEWLFLIFGLVLLTSLPVNALTSYLLGLQYHRYVNIVRVAVVITRTAAFMWVVAKFPAREALLWLSLVLLAINVAEIIFFGIWIQFFDRRVSLGFRDVTWDASKELGLYGAKSAVMMISGGAVKRLVPVVLAHAASTGVLVFYLIPLRLVDYLFSFVVMLGYPVTAYLANLNASHTREEFLKYWYQVCKVLQIVSFAGPAMLLWIGEPFIRRWMGPEIADGVGWPLVILTLPLLLLGVASNANRTLQSLGKHGPAAKSALVLAPITVGLAYPLGVMFGVNGVCAAVAFFTLTQGAIELVLSCRALGISTVRFTLDSMRLFVLPVIVLCVVFVAFRLWRYPTSYWDLLVECLVAGSFYLLTAWYCAFDKTERSNIFGMVDRYRNKTAST